MRVSRAEAFKAVSAALADLSPDDPGAAAEIGAEACLLALAYQRGPRAAAATAYGLADALVAAKKDGLS